MFLPSRITSTPSVTNSNGTHHLNGNGISNNGTESNSGTSVNYEKLKQELIIEFRKELQIVKTEIINSKFSIF